MTTWFVRHPDDGGDPGNSGTSPDDALSVIQTAVNLGANGDVVHVLAGAAPRTFSEIVNIDNNRGLLLNGPGPELATITGVVNKTEQGAVVRGFKIVPATDGIGVNVWSDTHGGECHDLVIQPTGSSGIGIQMSRSDDARFSGIRVLGDGNCKGMVFATGICRSTHLTDVLFDTCNFGIDFASRPRGAYLREVRTQNCTVALQTQPGAELISALQCEFDGQMWDLANAITFRDGERTGWEGDAEISQDILELVKGLQR